MNSKPAFIIAGTHSGCGKTTVTLGTMAALQHRGLKVQPFKCGPDFIDPTLHQLVTGQVSRNLDRHMCGDDFVRRTFSCHSAQADCAVIEGVMGLYDGGQGSAAALAKLLDIPVLLVMDVRSQAESAAAIVKGFASLDPAVELAGVICNRVGSEKHTKMIDDAIQKHCDIPVLGYLPRNEEIAIPSRHLGLHMGEEHPLQQEGQKQLIELMEQHIDLDKLLTLTSKSDAFASRTADSPKNSRSVRIAVARDAAFCFYYEDNLDMLRDSGAALVLFSPLTDTSLPPDLHGLYLGGGYPELYAKELSANHEMRDAIANLCHQGLPVYAECGGFMYLCRSISDQEEQSYPMAAVFPFDAILQKRLRRLGYREITLQQDSILAPKGAKLHGHEFHYSMVENNEQAPRCYLLDDGRTEGYTYKNTLAGYMHLHWGRTPEVAQQFVRSCQQQR